MKQKNTLHLLKTSLLSLLGLCSCSQEIAEKPNVLVILLDDAGYSSFGFCGMPDMETPCIDSLVSEGVYCRDAHVMASVSAPSRAMLMTGRYGQRFGFECNLDFPKAGVPHDENTLGDYFQQAGYATAALGKWHLGSEEGMLPNQQGFDYFYGFLAGARAYYYNPQKEDKPGDIHNILLNGKQQKFEGYLTDVLTDHAISYIDSVHAKKPFMMYLAYNAVHAPLQAPKEDLKKFEGHPRQKILAMTNALDRNIGRLVQYLKDNKIFDNTLIFFLTDNGGTPNNIESNFPYKGWKGNKYEGGHRVPFAVVYGNKIKKGTFDGLVSSFDIMATALSVADIKADSAKPIDGVNLIPYLTGEKQGSPHDVLFWRKMHAKAVRTSDGFKHIELDGYGSVLYNLNTDPQEENDLSKENTELNKKMSIMIQDWEKDKIHWKWEEFKGWPEVTDTIHMDLMNNKPISEIVLKP